MSAKYVKWSETKAKARELDPRTDAERAAGKAAARERREAYVRGHQLGFHTAFLIIAILLVLGVISANLGRSRRA